MPGGHQGDDVRPANSAPAGRGVKPTYHHPTDGRTQRGMIFSTGAGDELTFWSLVDFERGADRYYARYARVTPALRSGFVEIHCSEAGAGATRVRVSYELTALNSPGRASLQAYAPESFVRMIEEWRSLIEAKLPSLASVQIR